ncbi:hypothetical protein Psta_3434 [Pirellula staleyi DSM 6068]|uniref:Uncharacterized protein n=1 Tax=Pirellula staleyi (strain ATCC 27377 / DSM 6068 / ICPB 4128) TaxID=530564 RepID=D2QY20_PIRSD|nr:hypothetical protein Psta_3434 [Pirellula staleyi DSM 6068]
MPWGTSGVANMFLLLRSLAGNLVRYVLDYGLI